MGITRELQDADKQKTWMGRGWSYPVMVDPLTGDIAMSVYEEDIRQSLRIILSTARGERVMRPAFGCGIHELVYDVLDTALVTRIEASVREAVLRYEARIELLEVSVDTSNFLRGHLVVQIEYRVRQTNQRDNLVYPFYFREGGLGVRDGGNT
ncbi:MAG TPA: GPW/gp25 family protein [Povalibacter sp.]|uniref:GPW/gp25 family protein n=1 Tax=Povalibacter sp. TaxID=1962978 RepID=UPI002C549E38|nr:GPW/gp25 family protein [Povalibacter sp.]HMN44657.1 GPW/gp25 family protein [Povalibacter sp.]